MTEGFFPEKKKRVKKEKITDPCELCGLYKKCRAPKMQPHGEGEYGIYILAEGQGKSEEIEGIQLVGEAGNLFRRYLKPYGIDIDRHCVKDNAVRCRATSKTGNSNRPPTKKEVKCCSGFVKDSINEFKPDFIWLLGNNAIESFYGDVKSKAFSNKGANRWRHLCIPDSRTGAWVLPIFHPSYILRNAGNKNLESTFERDIKFAVSCLRKKPPIFIDWVGRVEIVSEEGKALKILSDYEKNSDTIVFDYETSALKPYYPGARIYSLSVAVDSQQSYSFLMTQEIGKAFKKILLNKNIKKIAHNIKFELNWSREKLGIENVPNIHWCTMNVAHLLDSRKEYTGLKFQSYINFGVYPYDEAIEPFLKSKEGYLNTVQDAPVDDLLLYGGMDSVLTAALYEKQKAIIERPGEPRHEAKKFWMQGLVALADVERHGICVDEFHYQEEEQILYDKVLKIEKKLFASKEAQLFKEKTGRELNLKKEFSPVDLRVLFFDILGLKSVKKTAKDFDSVDAEVLNSLKSSFAKDIITRRKLLKIVGYVNNIKKESPTGKMHPFTDLHNVLSFRSSSHSPNSQNWPRRDEDAKSAIRKGIVPSLGNKLACIDFGSQEVRVAECYTKDPTLIKYINDPTTDMHRDVGMGLFGLTQQEITKDIRFYAKNQFVFPEFYGSYFGSCARLLKETCWNLKTNDEITVKQHLKEVGIIKNYNDYFGFENHVKTFERSFWKKFHVFREWQDITLSDYIEKGYIEYFGGFRQTGYLTPNMVYNYLIQGSAFHLLLWCLVELNRIAKRKGWKSKIIAEIHDELIWDLHPEEEVIILNETKNVMEVKTRERFDWLIVPLVAEISTTNINESWYFKK